VADDYAYVAMAGAGVTILDVSNPRDPHVVVSFTPGLSAWGLWAGSGYLHICDVTGLLIFDVRDPHNPVLVASDETARVGSRMQVAGEYIYVAAWTALMISRFSPQAVPEPSVPSPQIFSLAQNYPNPFNATTTLSYSLDRTGVVELVIYNVLGQKAATLLDGLQQAGAHAVRWDASAFPSGVYLARLTAGEQSQTVRMLLLK